MPFVTRILVADDNRQLVEMLRAMLEDAGYDVVCASSGLAASALLDKEEVDLLILDVLMPGMSGDAVADLLRRSRPDLPVLLMTGDSGESFVPGTVYPVLRQAVQRAAARRGGAAAAARGLGLQAVDGNEALLRLGVDVRDHLDVGLEPRAA